MPEGVPLPELWLLGSSDQSAAFAAHFGCAFSFAHFITDRAGPAVMHAYREHFRASPWLKEPVGSIGVAVLCADTEEEANRLASSRDLWRMRRERGEDTTVPSVETSLAYPYSELERRQIAYTRRRQVIGAPEQVKEGLLKLGEEYGVDEFVVVTITHDFRARMRSYELLAQAFGLAPREVATGLAPGNKSR
jgi:luciferase family oxidoreductase group 1